MKKCPVVFALVILAIAIISFFDIQPARAQYLAIEEPDLEILGNTDVIAGTHETYVLQATLRNVSFPIQLARWTISNPRIASISDSGVLTTADVKQEYEVELTAKIPWNNKIISTTQAITVYPQYETLASAAKPKPLRLQKLTLDGPASLENDNGGQLTLTASYTDKTTKDVTNLAMWVVTPAESATISAGFLSIRNSNPKIKKVTVAATFLNALNGKVVTKKKTVKITQNTPPPPPPIDPLTIVSWGFLPSSPKTTGRNQSNVPIYAGVTYSDGSFIIVSGLYSTQWLSENRLLAWFPNPPGPTGGMMFTGNNSGQVKVGFKHLYQSVFYESQMWITVQ